MNDPSEIIRTKVDEQLLRALAKLPYIDNARVKIMMLNEDPDDDGEKLETVITLSHSLKKEKSSYPVEKIELIDQITKTVVSYELPFGALLNVVYGWLDSFEDEQFSGRSKFEHEVIWNRVSLRKVIEEVAKREGKVDKFHAAALLAECYYIPLDKNSEEKSVSYILSKADIIYHTFCKVESIFERGAILKRCKIKDCKKLFFAKHGKIAYCYFENPDSDLRGISCYDAVRKRRSRESSSAKQFEKELHNLRTKCEARGEELREWRVQFEQDFDKKKTELESDPWMYKELLKWMREYDEVNYPSKRKRQ